MDWEDSLKIVYGELASVDSGVSVCGLNLPINIRNNKDATDEERASAYHVILQHNTDNVDLDCDLYHYLSLPHFALAVRDSAFFLARPYTWSKSDDSAFNLAINTRKLCGVALGPMQFKFLEAYMRNTFGMCWSRIPNNKILVEKKIKDGGGVPVVEIKTTASKLLSAYLSDRDPCAPAKYFLINMKYVKRSELNAMSFSPEDLYDVNYAFLCHQEMMSYMAKKFEDQDEVRLVVERDDVHDEQVRNGRFFAKKIELKKVITGIRLHGLNQMLDDWSGVEDLGKSLNVHLEVVS